MKKRRKKIKPIFLFSQVVSALPFLSLSIARMIWTPQVWRMENALPLFVNFSCLDSQEGNTNEETWPLTVPQMNADSGPSSDTKWWWLTLRAAKSVSIPKAFGLPFPPKAGPQSRRKKLATSTLDPNQQHEFSRKNSTTTVTQFSLQTKACQQWELTGYKCPRVRRKGLSVGRQK